MEVLRNQVERCGRAPYEIEIRGCSQHLCTRQSASSGWRLAGSYSDGEWNQREGRGVEGHRIKLFRFRLRQDDRGSLLAPSVVPGLPDVTLTASSKADPTAKASVTFHIVEPR